MSPPSPTKKKKRRPINVSNDAWWNIFEWLFRAKLGLQMALVSPRFDSIVDRFLAQKNWSIGILKTEMAVEGADGRICCLDDNKKVIEKIPIAQIPPPKGLMDFKRIFLSHFDKNVLEFLRNLRHLFAKNGINLVLNVCNFTCGRSPKWLTITAPEVWSLFAENVVRLAILDDRDITSPTHRLSADFLCQCANLHLVDSQDIFPEVPPVDGVSSVSYSSAHALWKWLHAPREDGRPKILLCQEIWQISIKIQALKTEFSNAFSPVSFIIRLFLSEFAVEQFELRNDRTGEVLTLSMETIAEENAVEQNNGAEQQQQGAEDGQQEGDDDDNVTIYVEPKRYFWLLKRRPIGAEPKQWETEAIGWSWVNARNVIDIDNEEDLEDVGNFM